MEKIIISLAPVAADSTRVEPSEVADDVLKSIKYGASIVHLHVRKKNGQLTDDTTYFEQTINKIRDASPAIIQVSTGGISEMTIKQRCAGLVCKNVEMASLNVGSVNLGGQAYVNHPQDIEWCTKEIVSKNIMPEFEIFELGMVNNILELDKSIGFKKPMLFNIVMGHKGSTQANIDTLIAMRQFIPKKALWAVTDYGRRNFNVLAAAIAMGANEVRIGFEDSQYITENELSDTNAALVKKLSNIITSMDKEVATTSEARTILGLA